VECQDPVWLTDETIALPPGFTMTATASVEFHKRGNTAPAGTVTITGSRSQSKQVIVNITGRVRIN
jgi:hypothetical protein